MATKKKAVKKIAAKKPAKKAVKKVAKKTITKKPVKKASTKQKKKPVVLSQNTTTQTTLVATNNHIISKEQGAAMVTDYLNIKTNSNAFLNLEFPEGWQFNRSLFENLLALPGCTQIRIYNAVNSAMQHTFVIVGVDANENDIYFENVTTNNANQINTSGGQGVGDMGNACPSYDNVTSLVNGG